MAGLVRDFKASVGQLHSRVISVNKTALLDSLYFSMVIQIRHQNEAIQYADFAFHRLLSFDSGQLHPCFKINRTPDHKVDTTGSSFVGVHPTLTFTILSIMLSELPRVEHHEIRRLMSHHLLTSEFRHTCVSV